MRPPIACASNAAQIAPNSKKRASVADLAGLQKGGGTAFHSRLLVMADLHRKGFEVLLSASITASLYVVGDDGKAVRIGVRTPTRKKIKDDPRYQVLALVLPSGEIEYRPPLG